MTYAFAQFQTARDHAGEIALALGKAKRAGQQWRTICPAHDDNFPSLWLRNSPDGRVLWICRAGCMQAEVGAALRCRGLLDEKRRLENRPRTAKPKPRIVLDDKPRWLFERVGKPIEGSPVETYLRRRCGDDVVLPSYGAARYFPAISPHYPWPAMVALVTDLADASRILTLHFTYLLLDGSDKAPVEPNKKTLAGLPMMGGVVRLSDDADVTRRLGFAEGIEKSLAITTSFARDQGRIEHVWSALNAGNLRKLPVLPGIETLAIYGDANQAGRDAAEELKQRWLRAGREVEIGQPPGRDWDEFDGQ